MPTLALISKDPELRQKLVASLEGTDWSVEWLATEALGDQELEHDVVVLDAAHPGANAWAPTRATPLLLISEGEQADGLERFADDFAFRPVRREALLARLQRLHARTPPDDRRRAYSEAFASMAIGIVVLGPELEILTANPRSHEITGHAERRATEPVAWAPGGSSPSFDDARPNVDETIGLRTREKDRGL